MFFNQTLSNFQYYGITAGLIATVVISTGDDAKDYFFPKKAEIESEEQLLKAG